MDCFIALLSSTIAYTYFTDRKLESLHEQLTIFKVASNHGNTSSTKTELCMFL